MNGYTAGNELLIAVVILALFALAAEVGYRAGTRAASTFNDVAKSHLGRSSAALPDSWLSWLGFTFAMSLSRYDRAKELVTQEANAFDTAYLRAQLLPEPEKRGR